MIFFPKRVDHEFCCTRRHTFSQALLHRFPLDHHHSPSSTLNSWRRLQGPNAVESLIRSLHVSISQMSSFLQLQASTALQNSLRWFPKSSLQCPWIIGLQGLESANRCALKSNLLTRLIGWAGYQEMNLRVRCRSPKDKTKTRAQVHENVHLYSGVDVRLSSSRLGSCHVSPLFQALCGLPLQI